VFNIEIIKFIICHFVVLCDEGFDVRNFGKSIVLNFNWTEIILISVPAFVYTIQNNLIFIALDYLDPTTFQLCYQVLCCAAVLSNNKVSYVIIYFQKLMVSCLHMYVYVHLYIVHLNVMIDV
jgi:hypothetical protein